MLEFITPLLIKKLAEKVVLAIVAKEATDGIYGVFRRFKKSPEKRLQEALRKALQKALKRVSRGNEFWKNDVLRQKEDIIAILIQIMYDEKYLEKNTLPFYLDEKTINCH